MERFVSEAIESALAQDYHPFEVIVCDDCSTDGSYQMMCAAANRYRGSHIIRIVRNEQNVGVTGSVNRMMNIAGGELIIASAGDDISLHHRVSNLFHAWDSSGRKATSLHSRVSHIDEDGHEIERPTWGLGGPPTDAVQIQPATPSSYVQTLKPGVFGCAAAWTPSIFRTFGDLPAGMIFEDNLIALRSIILGHILFVDTPLVKYRLHGNNNFNASHEVAQTRAAIRDHESRRQRTFVNRAKMYAAFADDLIKARGKGLIDDRECAAALRLAQRQRKIFLLKSTFANATLIWKTKTLLQLALLGTNLRELREFSTRLMPPRAFEMVKVLRGRLS